MLTDPEGYVYAVDDDANYGAVAKIDPDTLHVVDRAEDGLAFMTIAALVNVYNLAERDGFLWAGNAQDQYRIWRTSTMTHVFTDTSVPGTLHAAIAGRETRVSASCTSPPTRAVPSTSAASRSPSRPSASTATRPGWCSWTTPSRRGTSAARAR
jgi:hypothetical protein